ncbi:hypothetical protein LZ30DRAFT_815108 [Colletotrichum cereale]|nr:hypothetical protein LZ30DRAFT_815108 [Colletotrichum cereale]
MSTQIWAPKDTGAPTRSCWLSIVPREVLFMVADQLPLPSRIALALVCKSGFASLCPVRPLLPLEKEDLLAILFLLSKDMPNWFLCFGCNRMRPLLRDSEGGLEGQLHPGCDSEIRVVRMFIRRPAYRHRHDEDRTVPEISFSEAHLVMNRHFHGAGYGLPTQYFESARQFERIIPLDETEITMTQSPLEEYSRRRRYSLRPLKHQWLFTHRTSAKVIEDELYICRHHSVSGPPCPQSDFSRIIDSLELPVCRHIFGSSKMPDLRFWNEGDSCIPELQSIRISATHPQFDVHPDNGIGSCTICFTDYEIAIERGADRKRWSLKLTTYHKLGSCRTPLDSVWVRLINSWRGPSQEHYREYGVGEVRERWLRNERGIPAAAEETRDLETGMRAAPEPYWVLPIRYMIQERYRRFNHRRFACMSSSRYAGFMCLVGQGDQERPGSVVYFGDKHVGEILDP